MFVIQLKIIPVPIRIWDLNPGDRFALSPSAWNEIEKRFEIYLKVSSSKCVVDSLEAKPKFSIPKIAKDDVGYKVIEHWEKSS